MPEIATFAAGCFWGVQAGFDKLDGIKQTTVGYSGGHTENPSYNDVCRGDTAHAECIEIIFDPSVISYQQLLDHFWQCHTPTTLNRQGPDVGSQYRSAIFYHDDNQRQTAEISKQQIDTSGQFDKPIVTEITEASVFYPAEEYHQKYSAKHG
ncbi:MAG: peptide-methionine (S)-S-oxide reductase MsrA [Coxiellaceae bacterium]|nr:peptide-methionine (S)-S-oxide reductase MsrA [Coxiellaceae bacterium]